MKIGKVASYLIVVSLLLAGCGGTTSSGKVLAEVNGEKITEGQLDFLGEINPRIQSQLASPTGKKRILDNLVEQELLYRKAVKEGINRDPLVKAKIDLYRRVIIAQALIDKDVEEAAKKYYDEHQDDFKKLKLAMITVKFSTPEQIKKAKNKKAPMHTEAEALAIAKSIKAKIDGGESFEAAARESSEDPATRGRGGNIGLVSKNDPRLTAKGYGPVLEKAFSMKVGEVSGPIKTADGYHLITVTRGIELEPFDAAKQGIIFKLREDVRQDLMAQLKKDAKIVYPEEEAKKKQAEEMVKQAQEKKAKAEKAEKKEAAMKAAPEKASEKKPAAPEKKAEEEKK